ncbi:MAG TPA: ABC transporter substrate-binding protein [Kiritimatiellia bacterium]|nr:ABC transporter substrate-binding protein [Kiritimatiellia bacterium]HMP00475.1 ABC transporter substrate-binding protein [Kiritimatiellia bacterium]
MVRNLAIIFAAALVISLPFIFRKHTEVSDWKPGDPQLVIISAHNEAIRYEFAQGFSRWHRERYGDPVKIDWRAIGGTSEIARYLSAEFMNSFRAWWRRQGHDWPLGAADLITDRRFDTKNPPDDPEARARWEVLRAAHAAFRSIDDAGQFGSRIDLFFGGGEYDHSRSYGQGLTVPPWPEGEEPSGLFLSEDGVDLIPAKISGEVWRTPTLFGTAVSTFGICYNIDRLERNGMKDQPPRRWDDLADPVFFRQLGLADPTKSGSVAKAFELMLHSKCAEAVAAAGFTPAQIDEFEAAIAAARLPPGELPEGVPAAYQQALEAGFFDGIRMIQLIGANARYFTDSSSKVPIDVSMGNAAVGIAIDFYGRYQAQVSRTPDGIERMRYITPFGGSGVSCDPISLLRGAPNREIAVRFIEYVLSEEAQQLWTYRAGEPGGPEKFSLRRVPIRREFFPSDNPAIQARHEQHLPHAADDLADPAINPYALAEHFIYYRRWTGGHFGILRDLIRAMSMDSSSELQAAWRAIIAGGGPEAQPEAMRLLTRLPDVPEPFTWRSSLAVPGRRLDYMREWTLFFRNSYREARAAVQPIASTR